MAVSSSTQAVDRVTPDAPPPTTMPVPARTPWPRRLVRYGIAFAILFGLWYLDRLRLEDFGRAGLEWRWALAALGLLLPVYFVAAVRLQCVLRSMGASCTLGQALSFTFYGAIAELALPFVFGGDLAKAVYVGRCSSRATAVATVLADRLVGLLGLCVFALLASVAQIRLILADEQLLRVILLLVGLSGTCLAGCLAVVFLHGPASQLGRRILGAVPAGDKAATLLRVMTQLSRGPHLWRAVACSTLGHGFWAIAASFLAYALNLDVPFVPMLLVLPIVAFCNALSFAGGIGGGLLAFEYLFHNVLGAPPGDGARLGIALPILLTMSKVYAIPWLFMADRKR